MREEVEKIVRARRAIAKIEEIRKIGSWQRNGEMVWVRFANVTKKLKVMKKKMKLWEKREWIADDLTEKERKIEWLIKKEAEKKMKREKKIRVEYMKLWVEGKLRI